MLERYLRRIIAQLTALGLLSAAAFAAVPTARISVEPAVIAPGGSAFLTWSTENAVTVTINDQAVTSAGTLPVTASTTGAYVLKAYNLDGSTTVSVVLNVTPLIVPPNRYSIHFNFDDATIRSVDAPTLAAIGLRMQANPWLRFRIDGHADEVGNDAYNVELGLRRAEAARDFIVSRYAIDPWRFEVASYGDRLPVTTNMGAAGRQLNRRVVITELP
jgi:outer membrane protein OmpA-like peptidoglycan-associated protein